MGRTLEFGSRNYGPKAGLVCRVRTYLGTTPTSEETALAGINERRRDPGLGVAQGAGLEACR